MATALGIWLRSTQKLLALPQRHPRSIWGCSDQKKISIDFFDGVDMQFVLTSTHLPSSIWAWKSIGNDWNVAQNLNGLISWMAWPGWKPRDSIQVTPLNDQNGKTDQDESTPFLDGTQRLKKKKTMGCDIIHGMFDNLVSWWNTPSTSLETHH